MRLNDLLNDKTLKPKERTLRLSRMLLDGRTGMQELLDYAASARDPVKATCIEALEFATKQKPDLMTEEGFLFTTDSLSSSSPRVKWESAKVIGNCAALFPGLLEKAVKKLLENARLEGTVVRWSAAYALGEILKLKTKHNRKLVPAAVAACNKEEKKSIQKIYLIALKKSGA